MFKRALKYIKSNSIINKKEEVQCSFDKKVFLLHCNDQPQLQIINIFAQFATKTLVFRLQSQTASVAS